MKIQVAKVEKSHPVPVPAQRAHPFQFAPRSLLMILRVYLGVILLYTVFGKMTGTAPFVVEMTSFLHYAQKNTSAGYQHFLQHLVIPHARLFSYLVMTGELVSGLSLLTGAVTRLGAGIAMFLFLNYMLAKGQWFWSPESEDAAIFFSALVVLMGAAGRVWGADAYLARRWPTVRLW